MSQSREEHEAQVRSEWVMIGHLSYDYEVAIVSSLFESNHIPMMIHGGHHRRMLGFIGGYIQLRVLVPRAKRDLGLELLKEYHEQRDDEEFTAPSEDERRGNGRFLLFNETGKRMGIALFLSAFLGFGLASLSAGLTIIALILACLQAVAFAPEICAPIINAVASLLTITPSEYIDGARQYVPILDLAIAWIYLLWRAFYSKDSAQGSEHA